MTGRHHPGRVYRALKAATRQAVAEYGGAEALSYDTRISRPNITRAGSIAPEDAIRYAPLDLIADVDAGLVEAGGRPVITEHLAQLCGFALTRLVASETCRGALARALREQGDVITASGIAQADGEISKAENAAIRREAVEAIDALTALIAAIDERKNHEPDE
ncbi:MAG: hypothetical protein Q9M33_08225 [Robiginitomaculum sp.]|nr:hypothetical protein [Robiginitomaculum sp.]